MTPSRRVPSLMLVFNIKFDYALILINHRLCTIKLTDVLKGAAELPRRGGPHDLVRLGQTGMNAYVHMCVIGFFVTRIAPQSNLPTFITQGSLLSHRRCNVPKSTTCVCPTLQAETAPYRELYALMEAPLRKASRAYPGTLLSLPAMRQDRR